MKDSHIYNRMNNPNVIKTYLHMINTLDIANVKFLVGNITLEASDHVRYPAIMEAYTNRMVRDSK